MVSNYCYNITNAGLMAELSWNSVNSINSSQFLGLINFINELKLNLFRQLNKAALEFNNIINFISSFAFAIIHSSRNHQSGLETGFQQIFLASLANQNSVFINHSNCIQLSLPHHSYFPAPFIIHFMKFIQQQSFFISLITWRHSVICCSILILIWFNVLNQN